MAPLWENRGSQGPQVCNLGITGPDKSLPIQFLLLILEWHPQSQHNSFMQSIEGTQWRIHPFKKIKGGEENQKKGVGMGGETGLPGLWIRLIMAAPFGAGSSSSVDDVVTNRSADLCNYPLPPHILCVIWTPHLLQFNFMLPCLFVARNSDLTDTLSSFIFSQSLLRCYGGFQLCFYGLPTRILINVLHIAVLNRTH